MKFINFKIFIISLAIGLLYVYLTVPSNKVIFVYPTPDNIEDIQYIDTVNNCHKYTAKEVSCSGDEEVKHIPVQR
mgnify:CR=1 FL=1